MFSAAQAGSIYGALMPTLFHIIIALLVVLLVLGTLAAARHRRARSDHGKDLGRAGPGKAADLPDQ